MAMAFCSILGGCISRKATANSHLNNILMFNSLRRSYLKKMSSLVFSGNNTFKSFSSSSSMISSSPWLMLPSSFERNKLNFNFYSLSQDKVLNFTSNVKSFMGDDVDYTDIKFVSSSHGWLTLFNPENCDLFLFNPLSGNHIKLPPIHTLPIPNINLIGGYRCVIKLITSCSPEHEDCRVVMTYGPLRRLAFCCPTISTAWTPIGTLYGELENDFLYARTYEDFVYSTTQKLFYSITSYKNELEAWDLQDTESPRAIPMEFSMDKMKHEQRKYLRKTRSKYLVRDEDCGHLYFVRRHVIQHMAPDGSYVSYVDDNVAARELPGKTIGFDVHKYDEEKRAFRYMDRGCLDGLAFFIGNNHSFAIHASHCPELKPNSIYFTDSFNLIPSTWKYLPFGGHDLGIFNYQDKTFSPCYYPCDRQSIKKIIPAPMWFTPINN